MEEHALKNVNNYLNPNISSYLDTSGGQSSDLFLNVAHFLTPVLVRHLWQVKTDVFLHWYLICYSEKYVWLHNSFYFQFQCY